MVYERSGGHVEPNLASFHAPRQLEFLAKSAQNFGEPATTHRQDWTHAHTLAKLQALEEGVIMFLVILNQKWFIIHLSGGER
jgi:hypothetical protein